MRVLQTAILIESHRDNFTTVKRSLSSIKYICVHYTGNKNDTAKNNCIYYRDNVVKASAHYYVSGKTVYQSVRDEHTAWAVGLGSRKEPYFKWPLMWGKVCNDNSISVEICGSRNSLEGDDETKDTAAQLIADLIEKYGLNHYCVYRHYDVTGKHCPAWAVSDEKKWSAFKDKVAAYLNGKEDGDEMKDNNENYQIFKRFMDRYNQERAAAPADWDADVMAFAERHGLIRDGKPKAAVSRGELAQVLHRVYEKLGIH